LALTTNAAPGLSPDSGMLTQSPLDQGVLGLRTYAEPT
jgi:hypothetical protein